MNDLEWKLRKLDRIAKGEIEFDGYGELDSDGVFMAQLDNYQELVWMFPYLRQGQTGYVAARTYERIWEVLQKQPLLHYASVATDARPADDQEAAPDQGVTLRPTIGTLEEGLRLSL